MQPQFLAGRLPKETELTAEPTAEPNAVGCVLVTPWQQFPVVSAAVQAFKLSSSCKSKCKCSSEADRTFPLWRWWPVQLVAMARVWDFSASFEPKIVATAMARIWNRGSAIALLKQVQDVLLNSLPCCQRVVT